MYQAALKSFQLGRLDVAERRCRKALSDDPAHADSLHLLGVIYAATNRLDLGVDSIAQAVRNNPTNPDYFFNLGTLLQRQGQFEEAFKSYNIALKLKPDFVGAWIRLGDLLAKEKQFDDALLTYGHVLTLDAANAEAVDKSARILLKDLRRYDEALATAEQARQLALGQRRARARPLRTGDRALGAHTRKRSRDVTREVNAHDRSIRAMCLRSERT